MRIAFFGDVVGTSGCKGMTKHLPNLRKNLRLDFVVVNGENAADGFGLTEKIARDLFDIGVDVITLGNHAWDRAEILSYIEREPRLLRPVNYRSGTAPGRGCGLFDIDNNRRVLVMNVMLRVFMQPLEDPFWSVNDQLDACPLRDVADAIIIDMHGEASSEKTAMGHFCDGRASLVVGTHTHIPTADARILPKGTAYQTDAGMCGDYNSVIGMNKDEPVERFVTQMRGQRFRPAQGEASICGIFVDIEESTGLATRCCPVRIGGHLSQEIPQI